MKNFTINFRGALLDVEVYDDEGLEFEAFYKGVPSDEFPNGVPVSGMFFDMQLNYELTTEVHIGLAQHNLESIQRIKEVA